MRTPLIYALHSGNLYGTERMALATAQGLVDDFDPIILAPQGPALVEARRLGFRTASFEGARDFAMILRPLLSRNKSFGFLATGLIHSFALLAWNKLYRRRVAHLHVVHGGTDERLSYGRKRRLNQRAVTLVAVSRFVQERLAAHGVKGDQIQVIENFLPMQQILNAPARTAFREPGVRQIAVISRVDPIKRVDLLLDALDREPRLRSLQFDVYGDGQELQLLRTRAARFHKNITFHGFATGIDRILANSDLLLHLCPVEPFGLAILEAMAARVPVLAADSGGTRDLFRSGIAGFHFHADCAGSLAARLLECGAADAERLNKITASAHGELANRFSPEARIADYRNLLQEKL